MFFSRSKKQKEPGASLPDDSLQGVNETLYKQNAELAVTNKTLSLLRKLYQLSLLKLDPTALSEKIAETIRADLNMEIAGILVFDATKDLLTPLTFAKSERMQEMLTQLGFLFKDVTISDVSHHEFFKKVIYEKKRILSDDINDVWGGLIPAEKLSKITTESHLKTILSYPLQTESEVLGALIFGLNRNYDTLNTFEQESINSFIDVIAVALDKAFLYKELQDANEKLKELDKLKTEFLSLASHQLRSPLTAIKGYTSMLLEGSFGEVNKNQKDAIDRVFESTNHLTKVVEDLLNVTKIEQGGMKYEMAPFDIKTAASDLARDLSITAEHKGLKLEFSSPEANPIMVNGDMEKIRQVMLNLIDNSIKYTEKGGTITVSVKKDPQYVVFSVTDNGMGISAETLPTLFKKFNRGEGGKVNTGGSGLGLYLAKQIIEAHKGRVWAESAGAGKGSSFIFELAVTK